MAFFAKTGVIFDVFIHHQQRDKPGGGLFWFKKMDGSSWLQNIQNVLMLQQQWQNIHFGWYISLSLSIVQGYEQTLHKWMFWTLQKWTTSKSGCFDHSKVEAAGMFSLPDNVNVWVVAFASCDRKVVHCCSMQKQQCQLKLTMCGGER